MITETKTAPKTARIPTDAVLRFHENAAGQPGKAFYPKVQAFEKRKGEAWDWLIGQLEKLADSSVRIFLSDRARLRSEWAIQARDAVTEFVALAHERHRILLTLGPAHAKQTADAGAAHEKAVAQVTQMLRDMGIDAAMPAANVNAEAAAQQLRFEAERDDYCLSLKGELNRAIEAERVWKSQLEALPSYGSFTIRWPEFPAEVAEVAALVGIERTTTPERHTLTPIAQRIARDFNVDDRPLLASHITALELLADLCPRAAYHPLMLAPREKLADIAALVAKLPGTEAARKFVADAARGQSIFDPHLI